MMEACIALFEWWVQLNKRKRDDKPNFVRCRHVQEAYCANAISGVCELAGRYWKHEATKTCQDA
jgi:hypothetical protein